MTDVRVAVVRAAAITSGGPTQDFTVTGFGTPKAAIFFVGYGVTNGTEAAHGVLSVGATDGTRNRVQSCFSEDAVSPRVDAYTIATKDDTTNDYVILLLNTTGTLDGAAAFSAWITDGVRITWPNLPAAACIITCVLIGGADAQVYVNDFPAVGLPGGTLDVTAPGFMPDAIFFFGNGTFSTSTSPASTNDARMCVGFSARSPLTNGAAAWFDDDNVTTATTAAYIDGVCGISLLAVASVSSTISVETYLSNGFTLRENMGNNTGPPMAYVAMRLPNWRAWAGIVDTGTATGVVEHGAPGFKPAAIFVAATSCDATATLKTDDQSSSFGVGAAGSIIGETVVDGCCATRERDAQAAPVDTGSLTDVKVISLLKGDATASYRADWDAWGATGPRFDYEVAPATSGRKFAMLALGESVFHHQNEDHGMLEVGHPVAVPI